MAYRSKAKRLIEVAKKYSEIVILAHDNPDPDAIASGWALKQMLMPHTQRNPILTAGGGIVRAENRMMVDLLKPPIELNKEMQPNQQTLTVMIDCLPDTYNHQRIDPRQFPVAAIDHHAIPTAFKRKLKYQDLRPNAAATASIVTSYLRELGTPVDQDLATALLYGIRTETRGGEIKFSRIDKAAITWLTPLANPSHLAAIEDAPLPRAYFSDLVLALQNTFIYEKNYCYCCLPQISGQETVGEIADLLIRDEAIDAVLCVARNQSDVVMSLRTERRSQLHAAHLVEQLLNGLGHGGGHEHRAGGIILAREFGGKIQANTLNELKDRWLGLFDLQNKRGERLIAKMSILKNL